MSDQPEQRTQSDLPDDSEPSPERQAELRAAYEANVAAGKEPYEGVEIRTRGELRWVMGERSWSGNLPPEAGMTRANLSGANLHQANLSRAVLVSVNLSRANLDRANLTDASLNGANLSGANLYGANLRGAYLGGTNVSGAILTEANLSGTNLDRANLSGAILYRANLSGANLDRANLSGAYLGGANLSGAILTEANLSGAHLGGANLSDASLTEANLSGANLRAARMDAATVLTNATLDARTLLADVVWNGAPVTRLNWEDVPFLGDEYVAQQPKDADGKPKANATRLREYQDAVMAYRQVATLLRSQGLNEYADRFAYRAQVLQRQVLRRQRKPGWNGQRGAAYLLSIVFDVLAGYGFRPGRALGWYVAVIASFALGYAAATHGLLTFGLPASQVQPLTWYESLILSVSSFHGRGFFQPLQTLGDPVAVLASVEAVLGLFIEVSFIATFTNRFFAR